MSLLSRIFKQALVTFDTKNQLDLPHNLTVLKQLVNALKWKDINLHPEVVSLRFFNRPNKAPCTYVELYDGPTFSMSVFVMAPNYTMPLHDHPAMHGILKCIGPGRVQVQSFSVEQPPLDVLEMLYAITAPHERKRIQCRKEPVVELDENSPGALLTPDERNMHQITALGDGPVAFFDILSPPYDTLIESRPHLRRKCTFFRVAEELPTSAILEKIPQPLNYYCDNIEYDREDITGTP